MEDILKKLSDYAKYRVEEAKKIESLSSVRDKAESLPMGDFSFEKALKKPEMSFICEVKKASPSKGIIAQDFPYSEIAVSYEKAGADAISVLTEPKWFLGSDNYLEEISKKVSLPLLRKDFTVDAYMIYEAKLLGAKAILLICSILDEGKLREYLSIAKSLGLSVLTEAHDKNEIQMALRCGADIIGVNNRNLKDFSVNTDNAAGLRSFVPKDIAFVFESGVKGPADVKKALESGCDAVLIGEAFMRAENKLEFMNSLKKVK